MKFFVSVLVLLFALIVGLFAVGTARESGLLHAVLKYKPDLTGGLPFLVPENRNELAQFARANLPNLQGKVALITGANKGLGFSTARFLGEKGAKTILACRDLAACEKVAAKGRGLGFARELDLSSLASVEAFASSVLRDFDRLDMLVLNAGMHPYEFELTGDGIEASFAVNHVAHQLLFDRLRPLLVKTAALPNTKVSVVVVASRSHYSPYPHGVGLNLATINDPAAFSFRQAYGQSKLANVLFAQEAAAQFKAEGVPVFVNSCHPGLVATDISGPLAAKLASLLGQYLPWAAGPFEAAVDWVWEYVKQIMWTPEQGALTQTWLAADPEKRMTGLENTGLYYHPIMQVVPPHPLAQPPSDLRRKLWDFTEELLRQRGF